MNKLISFYTRIATGRNILRSIFSLLLVYLCINLLTLHYLKAAGISDFQAALDSRYSYSPAEAFAALSSFQPAGRAVLAKITYPIDFILIPVYVFFFSLILFSIFSHITSIKAILAGAIIIPFIGGLSDLTENVLILLMINNFSQAVVFDLAPAANFFTLIKWLVLVFNLMAIFSALVYLLASEKAPKK